MHGVRSVCVRSLKQVYLVCCVELPCSAQLNDTQVFFSSKKNVEFFERIRGKRHSHSLDSIRYLRSVFFSALTHNSNTHIAEMKLKLYRLWILRFINFCAETSALETRVNENVRK